MKRMFIAAVLGMTVVAGASAAMQRPPDLANVLIGLWVVDEKARLEASPLYALATPEKKKEIERQALAFPATKFEFKAASYSIVPGPAIPYKIVKRGPKTLVLETTEKSGGEEKKDEITVEYVSDSALKMTLKSGGIELKVNRSK